MLGRFSECTLVRTLVLTLEPELLTGVDSRGVGLSIKGVKCCAAYGLDFSEELKWLGLIGAKGYGLKGAEETGFLNEGAEAIILLGFSRGGFWASRSLARRIAICFDNENL
jgi:hypothetical protein